LSSCAEAPSSWEMAAYVEVDLQAWNLEKLLSFCFDDKKGWKKGAGPLVFVMLHLDSLQRRREGGGFGQ